MVPWIAARDGPLLADVCARFGCTEQEVLADLDLLFVCGLHPYTPDLLIDVDIADGRVWIRYAEYFSRPLRLTPAEGLALLAAGKALLTTPGTETEGPLARGLAKLAATLGVDAEEAVQISLGPAPRQALGVLSDSAAKQRQVEIEYYAFGRDQWTRRVVDPFAVFSADGQWYVAAYCHSVQDERLFRVDRVKGVRQLESSFDPPSSPPELALYRPRPDDPRVTLELAPEGRWVAEQYPVERVEETPGGGMQVTLAVSERAWLERLLLRLGPAARVADGDPDVAANAARRLLERYRRGPEGGAPAVASGEDD